MLWGESGRGNHRGHGRGIFMNWVKFKAPLSRHGPTCGKHRLSGREGVRERESGRGRERVGERGREGTRKREGRELGRVRGREGKLTKLEHTVCTFTVTKNCANWNSFLPHFIPPKCWVWFPKYPLPML